MLAVLVVTVHATIFWESFVRNLFVQSKLLSSLYNVVLPDLALLNGVGTQCQILALEHSRFSEIPCLVLE